MIQEYELLIIIELIFIDDFEVDKQLFIQEFVEKTVTWG